ncbi:Hypothetical predicted protein [Octopus vulgaris]|uniref:Uncharacterized protein n=1 Tax=Octopus vulgaris TaxID=6645 RepID=A0AA36AHP1_OCTVU|nr:Hypothetical predicted protein [Octopus vulgaris]
MHVQCCICVHIPTAPAVITTGAIRSDVVLVAGVAASADIPGHGSSGSVVPGIIAVGAPAAFVTVGIVIFAA